MIHLRIVAPPELAKQVLDLLCSRPSVLNVVHLPGVARKPDGDLILCDVAREDASLVVAELRQRGVDRVGTISLETIDSRHLRRSAGRRAGGGRFTCRRGGLGRGRKPNL